MEIGMIFGPPEKSSLEGGYVFVWAWTAPRQRRRIVRTRAVLRETMELLFSRRLAALSG
jgi:hypothetical protein